MDSLGGGRAPKKGLSRSDAQWEFRETTTQRLLSVTLIEISRLVDTLGLLKAGLNPPLRSLYG
jgi:hypothetical protein